jgi:hypothetical protein
MAYFTISDFQTQIRNRGVARPNRFEVRIATPIRLLRTIPDLRLVSLFCESANLPSHNIGVRQQRIYGPSYQRPTSVDYGGDGITLSFILDGAMDIKGYFDAWMQLVVDPSSFHVNYAGEYTTNMRINQLNEQDQAVYGVFFEDVFPKTLSMLDLNQGNQNSVQKLNVTFAYRRWYADHSAIYQIGDPVTSNPTNPLEPVTPPVTEDIPVAPIQTYGSLYSVPVPFGVNDPNPFIQALPYDKETVRPSQDSLGAINNTPTSPINLGNGLGYDSPTTENLRRYAEQPSGYVRPTTEELRRLAQ